MPCSPIFSTPVRLSTSKAFGPLANPEPRQLLAALGVVRVNRANQAGIERSGNMAHFDWIGRIGDRCPHQRLFDGAANTLRIARSDIPRRRCDDLVILYFTVLHFDPMAQGTANRLGGAPAAAVAFPWFDIPRVVETEFTQAMFRLSIQFDSLVHTRNLTQMQAGPAHFLVHVQDEGIVVLPGLAVLAACHHLPCERACLQTSELIVIDGRGPEIAAVEMGVVLFARLGGAIVGMDVGAAFVVPG